MRIEICGTFILVGVLDGRPPNTPLFFRFSLPIMDEALAIFLVVCCSGGRFHTVVSVQFMHQLFTFRSAVRWDRRVLIVGCVWIFRRLLGVMPLHDLSGA